MSDYDVIIVGAGIQGAMMAAAATKRGQRSLLIERSRVGGATTDNSFGLVHGGLRYLQTLDVERWRRSRQDQAWYLAEFPDLVRPLRCVMPLYAGAFRSPLSFTAAFALEQALIAITRDAAPLPRGRLLSRAEALALPHVPQEGIVGAAEWHDVELLDPGALVRRVVDDATKHGCRLIEQAEVRELLMEAGRMRGIRGFYRETEEVFEFSAPKIVICAGPWSANLVNTVAAARSDLQCDVLAINLLFEQPAPWPHGIALSPKPGKGRSYFLRPYQGQLLAGTFYARSTAPDIRQVPSEIIARFQDELHSCAPSLNLRKAAIGRLMAGVLPGTGEMLRSKDTVVDHAVAGGPDGLFTVLGVKLTTARTLAERAARIIWPNRRMPVAGTRTLPGAARSAPSKEPS